MISKKGKAEMWSVFQSFIFTPTNIIVRSITDNCKNLVSPKQKANSFVKLYKEVKTFKFKKHNRRMKRALISRLKKDTENPAECQKITENEVIAVLHSKNPSKPGRPDEIHPRFLNHLSPVAKSTLLSIFNKSWTETKVDVK